MVSTLTDAEVDQSEQKELNLDYSPTTAREKKSVRNRVMTTPGVTVIEVGVIF